jgi:hypothetical protein
MRESRTYGSVRGARGNSRPYREPRCILVADGTSRHFGSAQILGRFRSEADIEPRTRPAESVENDPSRTWASISCCNSEVGFSPYQSACLSRYDAISGPRRSASPFPLILLARAEEVIE